MKIVITDSGFANNIPETAAITDAGFELVSAQCKTAEDVINAAGDADGIIVQWAPITATVINNLTRCKVIVRYGIGVDNVDLAAATQKGIPVCNVPDYCIDEVADHTVALALAHARQLFQIDVRTRAGVWRIYPDKPMPSFREMTFATAGYGRIARAVLDRARIFGFKLAAHDPYETLPSDSVVSLSLDELFRQADILSLHAPLSPETKHLVNAGRLAQMKPTAIVVNTARGGLIDTAALAQALQAGTIAAAGLDVFESEPLEKDHPLRKCPNAILTSHVAWFSATSVPRLQRLAAQEAVRALLGKPLRSPVNKLPRVSI
ncbi:MAG: C-terminal binding protein [Acidobacteriaceae bacterium]